MNAALQRNMVLRVALDVPQAVSARTDERAQNDTLFDYRWHGAAQVGQRVIVPWGTQETIGLIAGLATASDVPEDRLRDALFVLDDIAPLDDAWFELIGFAARYYQRGFGEVALPALPHLLRRRAGYRATADGLASRSMSRLSKLRAAAAAPDATPGGRAPDLNAEQNAALAAIEAALARQDFAPILLYGVTGSGKSEVYLRAIEAVVAGGGQVLVLVPEINLTPQLEALFRDRLPGTRVASLNSAMADGDRARHWLDVHEGAAEVLLATRMGVLASIPRLGLIVVDEEHDPSFKQQEGLRYSARDLAVARAQQRRIPVVLCSATPALETWLAAERGRYQRLQLQSRARPGAALPEIELVDLRLAGTEQGLSAPLRAALGACLDRGEQSLIFINRRGYAPAVACGACSWVSHCARCSVHAVYHKSDGLLHCHHCGWQARAPRACPDCGNTDLAVLGRGTQRLEESLAVAFPGARISRMDRDSTRRRGTAQTLLEAVHAGAIDILVGTQMVAKGHDFQNLTLVGVVDADSALHSHDFRAGERLFANLMQVAGRAGRADKAGRVLIQTRYPDHPLFAALAAQDYPGFAATLLEERQQAGLPPYTHQAMLRAEARQLSDALEFLLTARAAALDLAGADAVLLCDPVPMNLVRIAHVERAQLLVEARSRPVLQALLPAWLARLMQMKTRVRWHLEVDPLEI